MCESPARQDQACADCPGFPVPGAGGAPLGLPSERPFTGVSGPSGPEIAKKSQKESFQGSAKKSAKIPEKVKKCPKLPTTHAKMGRTAQVFAAQRGTHRHLVVRRFICWQFTYGVVSEGFFSRKFCGNSAEILRKFAKKIGQKLRFPRKQGGNSAEISRKMFLQWPLPEQPHK